MKIYYNNKNVALVVINKEFGSIFIDPVSGVSINLLENPSKIYDFIDENKNNFNIKKAIDYGLLIPFDDDGNCLFPAYEGIYPEIKSIIKNSNKSNSTVNEQSCDKNEIKTTDSKRISKITPDIKKHLKKILDMVTYRNIDVLNDVNDIEQLRYMMNLETKYRKREFVIEFLMKKINNYYSPLKSTVDKDELRLGEDDN